jgi:Mrp family chromosome partitioning ATPase
VLRANRVLILIVAVVFGGATFLVTSQQNKVYRSEAALSIRPINEDLALVSGAAGPPPSAQQSSSVTSERIDSPEIASRVKRALRFSGPATALDGQVFVRPEALTDFVVIIAESDSPEFAARLANEWAEQAVVVETRRLKGRLERTASSLRREFREEIGKSRGDLFSRTIFEERISRLDALRDIAQPVEIARSAEIPGTPASPKIVRNTLLGALIGLTLGIIAAFVKEALDLRLRGAASAEAELGFPLLGQIRKETLGTGMVAGNGRREMTASDADAFHIVRANLAFLDPERSPRIVAVTSALADEGKSTVAASLAWSHAAAGQRVLLLECDLRRPCLAERLGLKKAPGLSDYLTGRASSKEVVQVVPVGQPGTNGAPVKADRFAQDRRLHCMTAGTPISVPAEVLGSTGFRDLLSVISRSYDVTVLDCSPLLSVVDTLELLPHVESIVVCVRAGHTTRDQARAARGALARLPSRPTGLVVTGVGRPGKDDQGYYYTSSTEA